MRCFRSRDISRIQEKSLSKNSISLLSLKLDGAVFKMSKNIYFSIFNNKRMAAAVRKVIKEIVKKYIGSQKIGVANSFDYYFVTAVLV